MATFIASKFFIWCLFGFFVSTKGVKSDSISDLEIAEIFQKLLSEEPESIQVLALQRELLRKIQQAREGNQSYQRNLASRAMLNDLSEIKRNVAALARSGYLRSTDLLNDDDDANYKRSIAMLAKNGQFPMELENQKRGIEALARNGDLLRRKDYQDKRNTASLGRNYSFENFGKRSLSSIVRSGQLPYPLKRNVAALAKQSLLPDVYVKPVYKRSASLERQKRDIDYYDENPVPVYQNNRVFDFEDVEQDNSGFYQYPVSEKRFLGRLPQMGKPRTTPIPKSRRYQ